MYGEFFSRFKAECFYRYQFESSNEVKEAVKNYIKFYNNRRFQKKLNNHGPIQTTISNNEKQMLEGC
jgi:putative transposase